jgi:hypothetical protein
MSGRLSHHRIGGPARALAILVLFAAALIPRAAAIAQPPAPVEGFFGIGANHLNGLTGPAEIPALNRHASAMGRNGIDWVRIGLSWTDIEPGSPVVGIHFYRWERSDRLFAVLAVHGIRVDPVIADAPRWSQAVSDALVCRRSAYPATNASFAAFTSALAARYGRNGSFWVAHPELPYVPATRFELWNEPNLIGGTCPRVNPRRYASLYAAAEAGIRRGDPTAEPLFGGLVALSRDTYNEGRLHGMTPGRFVRLVLAARPELRDVIRIFALHTYAHGPGANLRLLAALRGSLRNTGMPDTPILLNEAGWYTQGDGLGPWASEAERTRNIRHMAIGARRSDCGVIGFALHTWATAERNVSDREDWYGVADPLTGSLHPSGRAYRDVIARYSGPAGELLLARERSSLCGSAP